MTLPLELGGIHDPQIRRALEILSLQFPVVVTGGGGGAPTGPAGGDLGGTYPNPTVVKGQAGFTVGGVAVILAGDAALTDARTPTGSAGGDLSGTYPNPQIGSGVIVNADINAAAAIAKTKLASLDVVNADVNAAAAIAESKLNLATDAAAGTGSRRTLGTGALQAAAGNDTRFTDARTPTAHHTTHEPGGSDPMAVDAAAATGSLRTLGTTATSAAAGNRGQPVGGTSGQVLTKNSGTDYDTSWATPAGGGSVFYDGLQQGVVASGDCALTFNSATQVTIAAGVAYVTSSGVLVRTGPTSTVLGSIPAASVSNFRLDQVVVSSTGTVSRLAGTQGTTVTIANRTGAAAIPAGSMLLHDLLVTSTGVVNAAANIRDRRLRARGSLAEIIYTAASASVTATGTPVSITTMSAAIQQRVECSGAPVFIEFSARMASAATANAYIGVLPAVDAAVASGVGTDDVSVSTVAAVAGTLTVTRRWRVTPAAGSHLFTMFAKVSSGTGTIVATAGEPLRFNISEDIRPIANNGTA